jgi:hypothetical protein
MSTDVTEEYVAAIFRVEEYVKQETIMKQVATLLPAWRLTFN